MENPGFSYLESSKDSVIGFLQNVRIQILFYNEGYHTADEDTNSTTDTDDISGGKKKCSDARQALAKQLIALCVEYKRNII